LRNSCVAAIDSRNNRFGHRTDLAPLKLPARKARIHPLSELPEPLPLPTPRLPSSLHHPSRTSTGATHTWGHALVGSAVFGVDPPPAPPSHVRISKPMLGL
jgi:hypothetical protein